MSKLLVRLSEQKLNDYKFLLPLEDIVNLLPHGSGFDSDWQIDFDNENYPQSIILSNGYHAMDGNGFYSGWLNFDIFIGKPGYYDAELDADLQAFEPEHWYHTFDIDFFDDDLDFDDGLDHSEYTDDDYDEDGDLTQEAIDRETELYMDNPAVNKDLLIEYINDTICESLQGIVSAVIVLDSED